MKKSLILGTIFTISCLVNVNAYSAEQRTCPAGCFCISGGSFIPQENLQPGYYERVCSQLHASTPNPFPMNMVGCGHHLEAPQVLIAKDHSQNANYYFDEFSEFYDGGVGDFYGFRNGVFTSCPLDGKNISSCPSAYPYSEPGSDSVQKCFKYTANGVKIYYPAVVPANHSFTSVKAAPAKKRVSARATQTPKKIVYKEIIFDESPNTIDDEFEDFEM